MTLGQIVTCGFVVLWACVSVVIMFKLINVEDLLLNILEEIKDDEIENETKLDLGDLVSPATLTTINRQDMFISHLDAILDKTPTNNSKKED